MSITLPDNDFMLNNGYLFFSTLDSSIPVEKKKVLIGTFKTSPFSTHTPKLCEGVLRVLCLNFVISVNSELTASLKEDIFISCKLFCFTSWLAMVFFTSYFSCWCLCVLIIWFTEGW